MFERYTERARRVVFFARYEASQFGSPYIEPEHMLLGLLRERSSLRDLVPLGLTLDAARLELQAMLPIGEKTSTSVDLPLAHECKRMLAYGAEEAERVREKHVGPEHLLLGMLREETLASKMLRKHGLQLGDLRERLAQGGPVSAKSGDDQNAISALREAAVAITLPLSTRPNLVVPPPMSMLRMRFASSLDTRAAPEP
jgi:ATP-dependent Clp protease ATP-binding subunit ClpC